MARHKAPKISVVVPAYNEEKYLPACLASLQKQTFRDFEVIVVDNNSTDNTVKIAKKYNVHLLKEKKGGSFPATARGFRQARGEIIARTDADTSVPTDWLSTIYNTFQKEKDTVAITGGFCTPSPNIPDIFFRLWTFIVVVFLGKLFAGHIHLLGSNMAIRTSIREALLKHAYDKFICDDMDMSCYAAQYGTLRFLPNLLVPLSLRKLHGVSGILSYQLEYPLKYMYTIHIHNPRFHRFASFYAFMLILLRKFANIKVSI